MWREFSAAGDAPPAGLAFSFPEALPPPWTALWRSVVRRVSVASDDRELATLLDRFVGGSGVRTLGFVNAHALNCCVADPSFAADLLELDHIARDGIGVHALYRLIGAHSGLNLNGTDLLPQLIARFAGRKIALFGTRLPFVERVAETLRRELHCEVVCADGFQLDGYYLQRVAREHPALVVLGMGMPKQERVARLMKHGLHQDVAVVCGGAILDFLSGRQPRAPRWMRRAGLEWAFRLSREPQRLFGRYVIGNPLFLMRTAILAGRGPKTPPPVRSDPVVYVEAEPFGLGGPLPAALPEPGEAMRTPLPPAPHRDPTVVPFGAGRSEFSANRPVVARDELFGREPDLDRMLSWVLDQSGNALIYGPRGYGKTSLVRVFGDIADTRAHVVLYASCSRNVDFSALMRLYLGEIPDPAATEGLPVGMLSVQEVATRLASLRDASVIIILDEFDRVERADTRESIVELVKDVSDLTANVRFVLVGVATDATSILGYHPSVHRCIACFPLTRLASEAVDAMFRTKAAADGLMVPEAERAAIVRLSAGSAYHAQLIGQKLVGRARRRSTDLVTAADLYHVVAEVVNDAGLMDAHFARLAADVRASGPLRAELLALARIALDDRHDLIVVPRDGDAGLAAICRALVGDGILRAVGDEPGGMPGAFRFTNAFLPQLLLMIDHLAAARAAA